MKASIVIPTYNRLPYLQKTLRSLARLTSPPDTFEVIVIDDGSNDETQIYLHRASFPFHFHFLMHTENRFASAARNSGITSTQGEIIVFLDDDMLVVPEFLEEHLKCHRGDQHKAVVGNIQMHPDVVRTGMNRYLSTRGAHKLKPGELLPFQYWCSGNASVRKSTLMKVGLFDENIRHYGGEDLELSYRLQARGDVVFQFASKAVSYHMHYRDADEVCRLMYNYGRTSLAYMIRKHPELAKTVRADLIEPLRFGRDPLVLLGKKMLVRTLMNPLLSAALKWYAERSPFGRPSRLFDYIIAYHYLTGLQQTLRNIGSFTSPVDI
jgi:glycosyltransferase involved in cell wall biosynthesis